MKLQKQMIRLILALVAILFITQGCVPKQGAVKLVNPPVEQELTCKDAKLMDFARLSDRDLAVVLDQAVYDNRMACWKYLMKKALEADRDIPAHHVARAVHQFNANRTADTFSLATYRYFENIAKGYDNYEKNDRALMKAWIGFEIRRAQTKKDERLIRAKRVCQRLDNDLYEKLFL